MNVALLQIHPRARSRTYRVHRLDTRRGKDTRDYVTACGRSCQPSHGWRPVAREADCIHCIQRQSV